MIYVLKNTENYPYIIPLIPFDLEQCLSCVCMCIAYEKSTFASSLLKIPGTSLKANWEGGKKESMKVTISTYFQQSEMCECIAQWKNPKIDPNLHPGIFKISQNF